MASRQRTRSSELPERTDNARLDGDAGLAADADDTTWPILAARAAASKKATDTVILEVGAVLSITGFFVITGAGNTRLVRTIAEEVEKQITDAGGPRPIRIEGLNDLQWVLIDYGDFVVHVFLDETRAYYDLERLWSDVAHVEWADEGMKAAAGRD